MASEKPLPAPTGSRPSSLGTSIFNKVRSFFDYPKASEQFTPKADVESDPQSNLDCLSSVLRTDTEYEEGEVSKDDRLDTSEYRRFSKFHRKRKRADNLEIEKAG
eukprot:840761-Amorphochlora_amoeboformis.AAC.2